MPITQNNKRIAKNTLMLYTRQIVILLISLYTVRVVLNVLGVNDFGVYNAVGGLVALFSFLSASMASATQRFFSFALGGNNQKKLFSIFSINLLIYIGISIIALLFLETLGAWFVELHLKIPADRFEPAKWIYHFSVCSFILTIMTSPFMAILIAHEDMKIYAYASIVESVLKLGIIFLLVYLPFDKLKVYAVLMFIVTALNTAVYMGICFKKYPECQVRKIYWDKVLFSKIIDFTGWTLFGQLSTIFRNQAVTILLNQVFNPAVVAARVIALNITSKMNIFSANFNIGLYPPIIKSYAAQDPKEMFKLIFNGSKITFFLMWIFALPVFINMNSLLLIWLKTPPSDAVLFTRLALVEAMILAISLPLMTAARAPGKMRSYELTLGSLQISIFLIDLIILTCGAPAYSVFIVAIIVNLIMFVVRLLIVNKLIGLPLILFCKQVVLPVIEVILVSFLLSEAVRTKLPVGLCFDALSITFSMLCASVTMYYIGIDRAWRVKIRELFFDQTTKIYTVFIK